MRLATAKQLIAYFDTVRFLVPEIAIFCYTHELKP
jgi:hypothetical protein